MKTISEWNKTQYLRSLTGLEAQPHPAGVACDTCGNEMLQKDDGRVLAGMPPKVFVWCLCGSTAYKVI